MNDDADNKQKRQVCVKHLFVSRFKGVSPAAIASLAIETRD